MFLKHLHLQGFRNYPDQALDFMAPTTILLGDNAQGKSNLLEAVLLLAHLQSPRAGRDQELIQQGAEWAVLRATLDRQPEPIDLGLTLRQNGRRSMSRNHQPVRRQIDFLGHLNTVFFSCLDLDLVRGGPAGRRDWLDGILRQLEPIYHNLLQDYQQALRQRNALLRAEVVDPEVLQLWNGQLVQTGTRLMRRRWRLLHRLAPLAALWHSRLSQTQETLEITYAPSVPTSSDEPEAIVAAFWAKLEARAEVERHQATTLVGPHRDEVVLALNQTPARQYGSQGQQRTLVLALKLAELHLLEAVLGETPILLLDDVLAELDLKRQHQLLAVIQDRFQTLITTTHLGLFDPQWLCSTQILEVSQGRLRPSVTPVLGLE
ncbi:MAG: DNA replication/repair protein RecF [Gloeomargaritaceae cyanobacterium C42_A2020_066]|nr:DNA replication/repair protein RecF [Gloeomargaritaceae cyanobacterium C42_A2020_066]